MLQHYLFVGIIITLIICVLSLIFSQTSLAEELPKNVTLTTKRADRITLDENNIPLVDYGRDIGIHRNPVTVAKIAEDFYEKYRRLGDEKYKQYFFNNVNWLLNNTKSLSISNKSYSVLESNFPLPKFNLKPPFISAMGHGLALSPLYNAFLITNNKTYLDTSKSILNSFFVPTSEGGATIKLPKDKGWWYEEVTGPGASVNGSRILNGMMFAVIAIHDYYNYTRDPSAKYLFDQGVEALKHQLADYDYKNGTWSYYSMHPKQIAPIKYQKVHVRLLDDLYRLTGEDLFKNYSEKWLRSLVMNVQ
jgi:hypothetical protein